MDGRLRILQVASHGELHRGGAVQMVLLARGLRARGHDVACVFHRSKETAAAAARRPTESAGPFEEVSDLEPRLYNLFSVLDGVRFRRWVEDMEFDVIHTHRDPALRFAFLATLGLSIPAFVTQRGTVYRLPRWGIVRWAFQSHKIDRIIAVSEAVRRSLIEQDRIAPAKISLVYGSYDAARFHRGVSGKDVRYEFQLGDETPVVGIVGALVRKKGHADFFRAAAQIVSRVPSARFLVVGEGKPERFIDLLEEMNLTPHVIFTGHRSDMPEVLAALDVLVCASTKGEGLTGAVREALAVGTPVVTTDVAGNTELVMHEKTGLVVPIGSPAAIAEAVVRLLGDREEAERLSQAAEEHVRRLCQNSQRVTQVEQIYREILARKTKRQTSPGAA